MTDTFRALCQELLQGLDENRHPEVRYPGHLRIVMARARAALVAEPQGPPKNCWLDDEPYLCPSPCVFDDPSEVIDNCVEARYLSEKSKPKEACKYYRTTAHPGPQGPMPEVDDILRLAAIIRRVDGNHDKGAAALAEAILSHPDSRWQHAQPEPQGPTDEEIDDWHGRCADLTRVGEADYYWAFDLRHDEVAGVVRAVLARWGRPAIEPVPVPGVEGADA
jgi:hypothetical protein